MGRPSTYTPEIVKSICDRLCQGEPLEQICRDDSMPSASTIHAWCNGNTKIPDDITVDIARARDIGYDAIADMTRQVARGNPQFSTGDVNRDKLIIETDLKLLAKWSKKYADRQHVEVTGKDGEPLSMRLIAIQQRLLKDITPEPITIEHDDNASGK
jgi:hypothetical protein